MVSGISRDGNTEVGIGWVSLVPYTRQYKARASLPSLTRGAATTVSGVYMLEMKARSAEESREGKVRIVLLHQEKCSAT